MPTHIPTEHNADLQPASAAVVVVNLRRSLNLVVGWHKIELPSRWVIIIGDLRKLMKRVRQISVDFMVVVHRSLWSAKHGHGLCETGEKASDILLDKRYQDHTKLEKEQFTKTRLHEITKSASDLSQHTNGIRNEFRSLRTVVYQIHIDLKKAISKREQETFFVQLSRLSTAVRNFEAELQNVCDDLDEVDKALDIVISWWYRIESNARYLLTNDELLSAPIEKRIPLTEINMGFKVLKGYFADYQEKVSELVDHIFGKLVVNGGKYLSYVRQCIESGPQIGWLDPGRE